MSYTKQTMIIAMNDVASHIDNENAQKHWRDFFDGTMNEKQLESIIYDNDVFYAFKNLFLDIIRSFGHWGYSGAKPENILCARVCYPDEMRDKDIEKPRPMDKSFHRLTKNGELREEPDKYTLYEKKPVLNIIAKIV